ncbi:MAG TPA: hypothetical protein VH854_04835 [Thermoanaerobaculia bacterium]|jgi:hypothetical protein|nr:hypothetical protein [Thermoanaerobaculia bacterium]
MRRIVLAAGLVLGFLLGTTAFAQAPAPAKPRSGMPRAASSESADGASVDAIIKALYESVSHGPDAEPDWKRMHDIFLQVGMLVPPKPARDDIFTVLDVDSYEERTKKWMSGAKAKGESTSFYETEVSRKTDCFGNVCQVFSTYASRHAPTDEKPFMRGINSIQLVGDGKRWWVASVAWDTERADNPIPSQYDAGAKVPDEYKKKN